MEKPIILISSCLDEDKVRYNGQSATSDLVIEMKPYVKFIKICPEMEIGLGVPREPIRIVEKNNEIKLIQHKTNKDLTKKMKSFSENFAKDLKKVDGFIFKSRSPSMGMSNIKVYSGMKGSPVINRCSGFFAGKVLEKFKGYPAEEDNRLRNKEIRDHFLTKVFLFSDYKRRLEKNKLDDFHARNWLLLDYYNSGHSLKLDPKENNYFDNIKTITSSKPKPEKIAIFFSKIIKKDKIIDDYKKNRISFDTLKEVSKIILEKNKILNQSFFNPYPKKLKPPAEEDRNKNYWKNLTQ